MSDIKDLIAELRYEASAWGRSYIPYDHDDVDRMESLHKLLHEAADALKTQQHELADQWDEINGLTPRGCTRHTSRAQNPYRLPPESADD